MHIVRTEKLLLRSPLVFWAAVVFFFKCQARVPSDGVHQRADVNTGKFGQHILHCKDHQTFVVNERWFGLMHFKIVINFSAC